MKMPPQHRVKFPLRTVPSLLTTEDKHGVGEKLRETDGKLRDIKEKTREIWWNSEKVKRERERGSSGKSEKGWALERYEAHFQEASPREQS